MYNIYNLEKLILVKYKHSILNVKTKPKHCYLIDIFLIVKRRKNTLGRLQIQKF